MAPAHYTADSPALPSSLRKLTLEAPTVFSSNGIWNLLSRANSPIAELTIASTLSFTPDFMGILQLPVPPDFASGLKTLAAPANLSQVFFLIQALPNLHTVSLHIITVY